jgi:GH15 family glucan-1,4-alpha-glucosidase
MPSSLYEHSITVILNNQCPGGAYLASPEFTPYRYSWFRDGAFIAYAMDVVGEHESARRFHQWAIKTILQHEAKINRCIIKIRSGNLPDEQEYIHTRFTPEGKEELDGWGHHQLDGLGTWLWSLSEHISTSGDAVIPESWEPALNLVVDYLTVFWPFPCYDSWEENRDQIHTYTLAALVAGLREIGHLSGNQSACDVSAEIRSYVLENALHDGHLTKYIGSTTVDANLLGVAVPYNLLSPDNDIMLQTKVKIENDLMSPSGGLHRYRQDTYYGGGEWVLLAAWLGWYYTQRGQLERAVSILNWVEKQATSQGDLPEQICVDTYSPPDYTIWVEQWGKVATPLLWSHAKYLILYEAIKKQSTGKD